MKLHANADNYNNDDGDDDDNTSWPLDSQAFPCYLYNYDLIN
jgi:hypothetical protein